MKIINSLPKYVGGKIMPTIKKLKIGQSIIGLGANEAQSIRSMMYSVGMKPTMKKQEDGTYSVGRLE
tara:strand:+ start:1478 stop:1678 length:201 start_codon:yes stop_codon:yes gene_type:complete